MGTCGSAAASVATARPVRSYRSYRSYLGRWGKARGAAPSQPRWLPALLLPARVCRDTADHLLREARNLPNCASYDTSYQGGSYQA